MAMTRISINPGRVDWSGENPGIYLKTDPANPTYDTLALFFRVVLSPYGRGHAAIVLGAPDDALGWPHVPNLIMTDNQRMMRWIVEGWVTKMPTFVGKPGLAAMTWLDCDSVEKRPGDLKSRYSETLRGSGVTLEMIWHDMGDPIPVEVTKENSATKAHEMYSVFLEAKAAQVVLNGEALPGQVADRQFFGRTMSTAFLAFFRDLGHPAGGSLMPLSAPITPGRVDWTGENPGILLKDEAGAFSAMALFFRVAWSPVGQGQVLLLYGAPNDVSGTAEAPNVMLTDNMDLAAFLKDEFIAHLGVFRDAPAFDTLRVQPALAVRSAGDPMGHRYTETVAGEGLTVELVWEALEAPKALELTPDQTGTGMHTMFTLLVPAQTAQIIVNGRALPGQVGERVQAGFKTTTAFLYFSETWVIPPDAK